MQVFWLCIIAESRFCHCSFKPRLSCAGTFPVHILLHTPFSLLKKPPLIRQHPQNCNSARYMIIKARDPGNNYTDWNNRLVGRNGWRQFFRIGNTRFSRVDKTFYFLAVSPNVFELCIFEFPPGFTAQNQALNSWLCHMPSSIVCELRVWSPWDKVLPFGSLQSRCE